jgi:hypothetical protein
VECGAAAARPIRVTFFDAEEKVYLPDIQICLVDDGNHGASEGDVTSQASTSSAGEDFVLSASRTAMAVADGQPLPQKYNITIETSLAGIHVKPGQDPKDEDAEFFYSRSCDPSVNVPVVRSQFWEQDENYTNYPGFEYVTKADEKLLSFGQRNTIPYFYSRPSNFSKFPSRLDFTRQTINGHSNGFDYSGFLSPFGVIQRNDDANKDTGLVIGAFPTTGCLTFFTSLCPKQGQSFLSRQPGAPIVLTLTGTGPKFKYFGVSIGQHDYSKPFYAKDVNIVYQKAFLNSTLYLIVAPRYEKPILGLLELLKIGKPPVFSRYSYSQSSVLPTSDPGLPTKAGNEIVNFFFTLEVLLSPKGVEHVVAQDPLYAVLGTIGGLWNFVIPFLYGLLYVATPKEEEVLHPTKFLKSAIHLIPCRSCWQTIQKEEETTDVEKAEGISKPPEY